MAESARDRCASPLNTYLLKLCLRRGPECTIEDLSAADLLDAEQLALECYRRAIEDAADDAPTQPRAIVPSESQTLPRVQGVWEAGSEGVTPAVTRLGWPRGGT